MSYSCKTFSTKESTTSTGTVDDQSKNAPAVSHWDTQAHKKPAKFLTAAATLIVGTALIVFPVTAQAEDADINETDNAVFSQDYPDARGQDWSVQSDQISKVPGQRETPASAESPSADSGADDFFADPLYPFDGPEGSGSD